MSIIDLLLHMGFDIGRIVKDLGWLAVLVLSIVQITPVRFQPVTRIANWIGRGINREVINKVDALEKQVNTIQVKEDERDAVTARVRILRFSDEIQHDVRHSKEHFDQILSDITTYEDYCVNHPQFKNNITILTIQNIKDIYCERLEKKDFI